MKLSLLQTAAICLLVAPAILMNLSAAQSMTMFWYADMDDILSGKVPDKIFKGPGDTYGNKDPVINNKEKEDGEKAVDTIRGSVDPPGSDINKVNWDPSLEKDADDSAKRCDEGSGASGALTTKGEIVVAATTRISYRDALALVMVQGRKNYDSAKKQCKKPEVPQCRQYMLLLSASLTGFACSRAHCPGTVLPYRVHCIFSPKPTEPGAGGGPYQTGTPCQKCPRDRGYCYNNMCVSHDQKTKIIAENPTAVVTCSAPCMNCGKRKDVAKTCSCHCPAGLSGVDCSSGRASAPLTCGMCERLGTPCLNGGIDAGDATCRCLCPRQFKGARCQLPTAAVDGGVNLPIDGPKICSGAACGRLPPDLTKVKELIDELKKKVAKDINEFCKKDQANYIRCCGKGTLPVSGPTDFVDPSGIHVVRPVKFDASGKLIAPVYAVVKGNNGLCRKTTEQPPPMVPVPSDVMKDVLNDKVSGKTLPCCGASGVTVTNTVKDVTSGISSEISCLSVALK